MGKKCDVLYVHSTKNPIGSDNTKYAIMPMGIIGILNNLKSKKVNVKGINIAIEIMIDPQYDIAFDLEQIEYQILLTDLHWYEHSFGAIHIARESKRIYPKVPVVIGGYTSTIFANEIMENFECIDYIVTGDSDMPMELLVDYLLGQGKCMLDTIPNLVYREKGAILTSNGKWVQKDLDSIDFIHTDFFKHSEYIPYLTTGGVNKIAPHYWLCVARGCKFNCAYCCGANSNMNKLFHRCNVLTRSPHKIASDFYELTLAGITRICPSHDFQMFGVDFYRTLFLEIRKFNIMPGMYLECFQLPTKDFIDELIKTFDKDKLVLVISPISGNEELRRENGKGFSNKAFFEILDYIKAKGLKLQLYYTLNLVGETRKQFMDTYYQVKYIHEVMGLSKKCIYYQHVVIDPLAGMRKFEKIHVEYNTFMDYYRYCLIPDSGFQATGFIDGGEMPLAAKREMFEAI